MADQSNRLRVFENQDQLGFLDYIWERCILSDWLDEFGIFQFKDSAKTTLKMKGSGCLCTFWLQNISLLLEAIRSMHEVDSFHGALNARQTYAFSGQYDRLKILGIGGDLSSHDEQSKASTKFDDVRGFRKMLADVLGTLMKSSGPLLWPEMNNFTCFDKNDPRATKLLVVSTRGTLDLCPEQSVSTLNSTWRFVSIVAIDLTKSGLLESEASHCP